MAIKFLQRWALYNALAYKNKSVYYDHKKFYDTGLGYNL